jgi:hypothetical protein
MSGSNIDAASRVKQAVIKSKREGTLYIEAQFRYSKQTHYKRVTIGPYDNDRAFVDEESKRFILHCDAGGTPATFIKRSSKDDPVTNVDLPPVQVTVKSTNKKRAREPPSIERQLANKNDKSPRSNNTTSSTASKAQKGGDEKSDSDDDDDDRIWVRCNTCDKWRALPGTVDAATLPDLWVCSMNTYDKQRNSCEVVPLLYFDVILRILSNIRRYHHPRIANFIGLVVPLLRTQKKRIQMELKSLFNLS